MPAYRSVFKDEAKLDITYVPSRLPHREAEMRLLREFFSFMLSTPEKMAQRVLIVGDVGTGKTALSQRFGADIVQQAKQQGLNLHYIHVNCRQYRGSLFFILHHAVSVFHPNFPKRGFSAEELLNIFLQILDEQNAHVILTLDEFENLIEKEGSEPVYKLTRLQETRLNKPQRISLICILKNVKAVESLDPSTRSTLQSNIIRLEKYSKEQLVDIISDRVQLAFKPLAVSEDTISLIAELAHSEGGNARFAIELLWRAGKYADAEDLGAVTPECVRKAVSSIYAITRKSDLASLSLHEKLFLLGMARFFKENDRAYASITEVEQAYAVVCEEFGVEPHTHTQLWKYLQVLSALGIIEKSVSSTGQRGRTTLICLPGIPAHELERELAMLLEKESG
ncbi:MAG: ORC1-type DNA replication protein [Candidatus Bathyarchaeota archaeon]|nr:ORC1-type DNA replication protein [Candidatus Bathyarchaeota archaeon A05DMB-3]MDH7607115.1 ORC1-type DNA replication protein [Candidatus Bathyarchaeota archaeon]